MSIDVPVSRIVYCITETRFLLESQIHSKTSRRSFSEFTHVNQTDEKPISS
jgi:hypothetical protein